MAENRHKIYQTGTLISVILTVTTAANADVTLPSIFSDHAVLQKSAKVPIWGRANSGEKITVTLDSASANAIADQDGKWTAVLNLQDKGPGPYTLSVEGNNKIVLSDILVGEVWLCSGQSNMELTLSKTTGAAAEISQSANPLFRQFYVGYSASLDPQESVKGYWSVAGPAASGAFTGVGYYFGKMLQSELKTPVALIHSSWGGTPVEAWVSREALDRNAALKAMRERMTNEFHTYPERLKNYLALDKAWESKYQRGDQPSSNPADYAAPDASVTDWKPVQLPGKLSSAGLPDAGAVWLRHQVTISPQEIGTDLQLDLGVLTGLETVYWNGVKIGETTLESGTALETRRYKIPAKLVQSGTSVLAVRLFNPAGGASVTVVSYPLKAGATRLTGEWLGKAEFVLPALDAQAKSEYPLMPSKVPALSNTPTGCFNGKIHPLLPYAIRGALWYQGESNTAQGYAYRDAFRLLIEDWRTQWGQGDFPFYFCQLPGLGVRKTQPGESDWAELRESQATALTLPATAMATLIDAGEQDDIHPKDKKTPGERLARIALSKTYGRKMASSGPVYQTLKIDGSKAIIRFSSADGGLIAQTLPERILGKSSDTETQPLKRNSPKSELEGFAICGEDKQWKWADARIEGDHVIVWSEEIAHPIAVRYAWANDPICNLYNTAGLPASPFRTDNFPASTQGK